ncbi:MAG: TIR domain-containing protein [Alphaproteobacteria bacterium]|nr:MAG: TIR domain-containing protein [Alphaproteobacteria bacterium]
MDPRLAIHFVHSGSDQSLKFVSALAAELCQSAETAGLSVLIDTRHWQPDAPGEALSKLLSRYPCTLHVFVVLPLQPELIPPPAGSVLATLTRAAEDNSTWVMLVQVCEPHSPRLKGELQSLCMPKSDTDRVDCHIQLIQAILKKLQLLLFQDSTKPKLFLSHAKYDGRKLAEKFSKDTVNRGLDAFFDEETISLGEDWRESIRDAVVGSIIIAFETDQFSSRYWCRHEVMLAKVTDRPILLVLCQQKGEPQRAPHAGALPTVRLSLPPETSGLKQVLLEALKQALFTFVWTATTKGGGQYPPQADVGGCVFVRTPDPISLLTDDFKSLRCTVGSTWLYPGPALDEDAAAVLQTFAPGVRFVSLLELD